MKATLLKRLFSAIHQSQEADVLSLCDRIIEDEKRSGHEHLATELKMIAERGKRKRNEIAKSESGIQPLVGLPSSRRDSAPLVQVIKQSDLRHNMVLPEGVESRFLRIEKEYAARTRLASFGLRARNRILLHGPPGCGKSLGAERLAWATGLPMHKVRFDTLISSYFGETAVNLRRVFEAAHQSPCALFLDECDTIARARGDRNDVGEAQRVVNMLLQMLEDFRGDGIVIAATNLEESLDRAIMRRFDEVIEIPKPGHLETVKLLRTTLDALKVDPDVSLDRLAIRLDGLPCSEVVRTAQNAAKRAVIASRSTIACKDLESAISEIKRLGESA